MVRGRRKKIQNGQECCGSAALTEGVRLYSGGIHVGGGSFSVTNGDTARHFKSESCPEF